MASLAYEVLSEVCWSSHPCQLPKSSDKYHLINNITEHDHFGPFLHPPLSLSITSLVQTPPSIPAPILLKCCLPTWGDRTFVISISCSVDPQGFTTEPTICRPKRQEFHNNQSPSRSSLLHLGVARQLIIQCHTTTIVSHILSLIATEFHPFTVLHSITLALHCASSSALSTSLSSANPGVFPASLHILTRRAENPSARPLCVSQWNQAPAHRIPCPAKVMLSKLAVS